MATLMDIMLSRVQQLSIVELCAFYGHLILRTLPLLVHRKVVNACKCTVNSKTSPPSVEDGI